MAYVECSGVIETISISLDSDVGWNESTEPIISDNN